MQTPAPQLAKLAKLLDPALAKTPGALLLPSAQRKNMRLPRSASKKFTTPKQQGMHWDVSDGDIDPDVSADQDAQDQVDEPDYDEIEYMPPKVPGMFAARLYIECTSDSRCRTAVRATVRDA